MPTTKSSIRNHPAYVALQNRLDIQHDLNEAQGWKDDSLSFLQDLQHSLEIADYLHHLPESAFFVYSSPKAGLLVVHCAVPLIATETRILRDFSKAIEETPFYGTAENELVFTTKIVIVWQSVHGRTLPAHEL